MAASQHPTFNESLIILCSSLIFTLENWDKYLEMIGADGMEDSETVKGMMQHLADDLHMQIEMNDRLADAMEQAIKLITDARKANAANFDKATGRA